MTNRLTDNSERGVADLAGIHLPVQTKLIIGEFIGEILNFIPTTKFTDCEAHQPLTKLLAWVFDPTLRIGIAGVHYDWRVKCYFSSPDLRNAELPVKITLNTFSSVIMRNPSRYSDSFDVTNFWDEDVKTFLMQSREFYEKVDQ